MSSQTTETSAPSAMPALLFLLLAIGSVVLFFLFADLLYGSLRPLKFGMFHFYAGLIFSLISVALSSRAVAGARRVKRGMGVGVTILLFSLLCSLVFAAFTALFWYENISRGRSLLTGD